MCDVMFSAQTHRHKHTHIPAQTHTHTHGHTWPLKWPAQNMQSDIPVSHMQKSSAYLTWWLVGMGGWIVGGTGKTFTPSPALPLPLLYMLCNMFGHTYIFATKRAPKVCAEHFVCKGDYPRLWGGRRQRENTERERERGAAGEPNSERSRGLAFCSNTISC